MTASVISRMQLTKEEDFTLREEIIERLKNSNRYEQAADMICSLKEYPKRLESAMDCYLKANRFLKAYQLIVEEKGGHDEGILMNTVRTHVKITYDVKKN
jgi:hypothetical protein